MLEPRLVEAFVLGNAGQKALDVPLWSLAPFFVLLLCIALLPLLAEHFWHSNLRKLLVSLGLGLPVVGYLVYLEQVEGQPGMDKVIHALWEYFDFIVLLGALYTVAGGIVIEGDMRPTPFVNTFLLAIGAVLANYIGTTGASMLLIRPFLRINRPRIHTGHLPVFFIFLVSNLGGLLTPLGDPPLFLGFLHGVDFTWTFGLWPQWLTAVGSVLVVFFVWDCIAYWREPEYTLIPSAAGDARLRIRGTYNFLFLIGILLIVLLQSETVSREATAWLNQFFACPDLHLVRPWGGLLLLAMALLSLLCTPRRLRQSNDFTWGAMVEVAVLFLGIFLTMIPALEYLARHGHEFNLTEPWQYFWLTGSLSSFLDNAPTYLTFATMAAGSENFRVLVNNQVPGLDGPLILQAISCGAVFMGANTYIGNGPNFMVKAIAESAGYKTPSFFGYMAYSIFILLPIFGLISVLFFLR